MKGYNLHTTDQANPQTPSPAGGQPQPSYHIARTRSPLNERTFTLIIEPTNACNLRCRYCYAAADDQSMNRRTLETTLERTANYLPQHSFSRLDILWHGGEPLLAGLSWYRFASELARRLMPDVRISHYLQTNGILLDPAFCRFFRDHDFQIGISMDAFAGLHDAMRRRPDGGTSHKQVAASLKLAARYGLGVGINMVASRPCLGREKEIYTYFQGIGQGFRVNPLIPGQGESGSSPSLLAPGEYGQFLERLFDEWLSSEGPRVRISPLDSYLKAIVKHSPMECQQQKSCVGSVLGVKPSGDCALCSRFSSHFIGNVETHELAEMFASPFCEAVNSRADALSACHDCSHWSICHGGCPHNALLLNGDPMARDYFCQDYRRIYSYLKKAVAGCRTEEQG